MTLWRSLRKVSAEGESRPEIRDGEPLRQKDRDTRTGAEARFFVLYSGIAADKSFCICPFFVRILALPGNHLEDTDRKYRKG